MDSPIKRSGSKIPHVPSFNDFCSGCDPSELAAPPAKMTALKVPGMASTPKFERSWSLDSDEFTPRTSSTPTLDRRASFAETFTRALYEHMRTN